MANDLNDLLMDKAQKFVLPNYKPFPIVMDKGDGALLYDVNGKSYIDFVSGIAVSSLGYGDKDIQSAISAQCAKLMHVSNMFLNQPVIELANRLCQESSLNKVFFCNSGAEANEAMLKLARRAYSRVDPSRIEIICMKKAFHGRTLGTISATGQEKYRAGFGPLLPGFKTVEFGDIDALKQAMDEKTAAVIMEPILGEGGIVVPPSGYLSEVRSLCDTSGALLLIDEVQTGIGRTGTMFAFQQENIIPDAVALAKGLGGGLPIGAMLVREKYASILDFPSHGSTFGGNPVSCAAANVVVGRVSQKEFLSHVNEISKVLIEKLTSLKKRFPQVISEIRGRGLLLGVQFREEPGDFKERALRKGLITNFCGDKVMRIAPPLVISKELVHQGVGILEELFEA